MRPAGRNVDYDSLFEAYCEQVGGLLEGGVDLLLFETVFDTLNLKAGLDAADRVMEAMGKTVPVMVSATMSDKAGRTLSGQTLGAFLTSIEGYDNVVTVGLYYNYEKGQYATIPFAYNDAEGTLVIGDRTGEFPGMLKERTFNVVKVSKDQPQPFDLKAKGTTVKYDGNAQTVKL